MSMCSASLRELSNPGASGSIFYLTDDDEFIIKTVQHKEGEFLQTLLPGYYMVCSIEIDLELEYNIIYYIIYFSNTKKLFLITTMLFPAESKSESKNIIAKVFWIVLLSV